MNEIQAALAWAVREHQAGRLEEAENVYRRVLVQEPANVDAWNLLGMLEHQRGRHEIAEEHLRRAVAAKPDFADAHNNLGIALMAQGKVDDAVRGYQRALELNPRCAEAHFNLGNYWQWVGRLDEATSAYERALAANPDHAGACCNLGAALQSQRRNDEAVTAYLRAMALDPANADTAYNLGTLLQAKGKLEQAIHWYREAVRLAPRLAEAWFNLGNALKDQEKFEEAVECYQRAIQERPDYWRAWGNMGIALAGMCDFGGAARAYERALAANPDFAWAMSNLGVALREEGRIDEAMRCFERAIELDPELASAHSNRAILRLLKGDLEGGWAEYEWRWKLEILKERPFSQPRWEGELLMGRSVFLRSEQGLGDELQFIRYARLVKRLGARVIVESPPGLRKLLSRCAGIDAVVEHGEPLPDFDFHVPLLSLPRVLGTTLENIPDEAPYLFADPELVERWRERLAAVRVQGSGFRVQEAGDRRQETGGKAWATTNAPTHHSPRPRLLIGINWRGRPGRGAFRLRDIPLAMFERLAEIEGVRLVSLQRREGREELVGRAHPTIFDPGDDVDTAAGAFMDTAAIMKNLDLVVTSDTAVAHLAGGLGVRVWVLLPFAADWRWLLNRRDSPWYPTMRLFRQRQPGDWVGVFGEIRAELERLARG